MAVSLQSTLHSTMFLLKPTPGTFFSAPDSSFTFHNVSIKTSLHIDVRSPLYIFTFHNVSIKMENPHDRGSFNPPPLHSTMFLLKLPSRFRRSTTSGPLHSTMFLLKPDYSTFGNFVFTDFTFHNVSIKTIKSCGEELRESTLHSTMFLLKRFQLTDI